MTERALTAPRRAVAVGSFAGLRVVLPRQGVAAATGWRAKSPGNFDSSLDLGERRVHSVDHLVVEGVFATEDVLDDGL